MVFMFNELALYLIASFKSFVHWKCRENNLGFQKIFLDFYCYNVYALFVATNQEVNIVCAMKKGTKLTSNPKDFMLRVRLDKTTLSQLDMLCKEQNKTRSEIVRGGIKIQCQ